MSKGKSAPAPEPVHEAEILTELEAKLAEVAGRIKARHPAARAAGCGVGGVRRRLEKIVAYQSKRHKSLNDAGRVGLLSLIDKNHEGWCASQQWLKDGEEGPGTFAKGLENWLAHTEERYMEPPPPPPLANVRTMQSRTVRAAAIYLNGNGAA